MTTWPFPTLDMKIQLRDYPLQIMTERPTLCASGFSRRDNTPINVQTNMWEIVVHSCS